MNQNFSVFNHNLILTGEFTKDFNQENARIFCSLAFTPGGNISLKASQNITQTQLAEIFQKLADSIKSNNQLNILV